MTPLPMGAYEAPKIHEDAFWRDRVCEALGLPLNSDNDAIFDAMGTHLSWKDRAARVLGVTHKISTAALLEAHRKHMAGIGGGNKAAATIQNEEGRRIIARSLINTLVHRGVRYEIAFRSVRSTHPNLFRS